MWHQAPLSHSVAEAIGAVIKQYSVIIDAMEEVNQTTHDEYSLKAAGVLAALEKFEMLFGLKWGHLLFSAAEQTSRVITSKRQICPRSSSAVNAMRAFCQCQRQDDAFIHSIKAHWHKLKPYKLESQNCQGIGNPKNTFGGSEPHNFSS